MGRRMVLLVVAVVMAVLGAGLVYAYAQGAEDRAADDYDTVEVLVARDELAPGTDFRQALDEQRIRLVEVPRGVLIDGSTASNTQFEGRVSLTTIYPGEQIIAEKFGTSEDVDAVGLLSIPTGKLAVTVELSDTGRVGSFTQPGSHVAVFVTSATQPGGPDDLGEPARLLYEDMQVLGVGSRTLPATEAVGPDGLPIDETSVTLLTLAVTQREGERLIALQNNPEKILAFALRNDDSDVVPPPDAED
ncbi:Flp pilus assembly protein CpaB [Nocardioides dongxiaopingii]|uniref:Flp pilus assembly protein CpaB n=1 Tax=Nocardioides sp. S-1144 TaxID=2582905 RepID=UPI00110D8CB4|nr:Flp pilus assembly protein CpaB [Nocardioides sp. S-1144]QCW51222.1 Flp pilus assembly protein CpaB [Nocardioides sp. S-1144]